MRSLIGEKVCRRIARIAVLAAPLLFVSSFASAQTTTVINYTINVPVYKTVPKGCGAGFVLVNGTMNVTVTTILGSDFKLSLKFVSSGRGDDADINGSLLSSGNTNYSYSSSTSASAAFPNGAPSYFDHTLELTDYLARVGSTSEADAFLLSTVFDLVYTNGVPTAATLQKIDVSCK